MAKLSDINLLSVGNTIGMVGAIYAGEGKTLLVFFPGEKREHPIDDLEMDSEEWKTFLRQTDILETEILTKANDREVTKAIVRKSQRSIDGVLQWKVFKRDFYKCRYCGKDDLPLTVDHLVLWEEGGPTIEENLVAACKKCNKARGNTQYVEWLQHPHYLRVSKNLSALVRADNEALVSALASISKLVHARSR